MKAKLAGIGKLNLEPGQEDYLNQCVAAGRVWIVTRQRSAGRCIQASGETKERVQRCFDNWRRDGVAVSLIKIEGDKVTWPDSAKGTNE
jgi:hypothetical protein